MVSLTSIPAFLSCMVATDRRPRNPDHQRLEADRCVFEERVAKGLYKENRSQVTKERRNVIIRRCELAGYQKWGVTQVTKAGNGPTSDRRRNIIARLIRRDGPNCWYCQRAFTDELLPTLDHIIPRSKNGSNTMANYRAACNPCNVYRKNRSDVLHKGALRSMMAKRFKDTSGRDRKVPNGRT